MKTLRSCFRVEPTLPFGLATVLCAILLLSPPRVAMAQLEEVIGGDELGHCPPKGSEIGTGGTQWTEDVDKDGDGIPDYRWNKEYTDSDGNVVRVYCLSKGGWRFAITYNNKIVGICPYESGCNVGVVKRATPGGKIKATEWSSKDGEYGDTDDDSDKDKDEMKYGYDVASNDLDSTNKEGGTAVPGASASGPPPTLGDGTLPPSWGTPSNPTLVSATSNGLSISAGCECATVAHWTFDEDGGNSVIDVSRNGISDGIMVGPTRDVGLCGLALRFDGIDDYVTIPHTVDLEMTEGTVEILFRPASGFIPGDPAEELLQKDAPGLVPGNTSVFLGGPGPGSGRLVARAEDSLSPHEIVTDYFSTGWVDWWYHIAYVFDASGMRVYVNQVLQADTDLFAPSWLSNTNSIVLGYDVVSAGRAFDGWIDQVRISAVALTPNEFIDCPSVPVSVRKPAVGFAIHAHPNPFNTLTTIEYVTGTRGLVTIRAYDVGGRLVSKLVNAVHDAGEYAVDWDGRDDHGKELATGVYFVRFESSGELRTRKIVILR